MRLYLIRHADPDYAAGTITAAGHAEAKALAGYLAAEGLERVYSSPLQRALETARYTAESTGIGLEVLDWAAEMDEWKDSAPGYVMPFDLPGDVLAEPERTQENWSDHPAFDGRLVRETYEARMVQADDWLKGLGLLREEGHYVQALKTPARIVLFCHAGLGNALLAHWLNVPLTLWWAGFWCAPSSVTQVVFEPRENGHVHPRVIAYGETTHLHEAGLPVRPRGLKEKASFGAVD